MIEWIVLTIYLIVGLILTFYNIYDSFKCQKGNPLRGQFSKDALRIREKIKKGL